MTKLRVYSLCSRIPAAIGDMHPLFRNPGSEVLKGRLLEHFAAELGALLVQQHGKLEIDLPNDLANFRFEFYVDEP